MQMNYGEASNRLNELKSELPHLKKRFDSLINSVASLRSCYTPEMERGLAEDLDKLELKWRKEAASRLPPEE